MEKTRFLLQKKRIFQAPRKVAQPFLAPELRTETFTDTRIFRCFPIVRHRHCQSVVSLKRGDNTKRTSAPQPGSEHLRSRGLACQLPESFEGPNGV